MGCGAPPAREFDGLIVWEEELSECERSRGASGTSKVREFNQLIGFGGQRA